MKTAHGIILLMFAFFTGALTLEEAIERGLSANAQVRIAELSRDAAREDARATLTALLPRAKVDASFTHLDKTPVITMPPEFGGLSIEMGKQDNYNLTLGVQQPIFTGGKIINGVRAASFGAKIQAKNLEREQNSTVVSIAQAYFGVVKAELFLNSVRQARERMDGHLAVIEGMFSQGLISRNDLLQTRVASSEIDLLNIRAQNAVKATRLGLNFLLDYNSDSILALDPDTSINTSEWPSSKLGLDLSLENRPDIQMLELGLKAARAGEAAAWGSFSPDVIGLFNWSYKRPNQANEEKFYDSWNITLAASWELISFGERLFKVRKARAQRNQTEETLDMARRAADMEIRNLYNAMEEARGAYAVSSKRLEQANESFRVAVAEFSTGLATNTSVLDANSSLIQAQAEHISAVADVKIAEIQYSAATGTILKERK